MPYQWCTTLVFTYHLPTDCLGEPLIHLPTSKGHPWWLLFNSMNQTATCTDAGSDSQYKKHRRTRKTHYWWKWWLPSGNQTWPAGKWTIEISDFLYENFHSVTGDFFHCHLWLPEGTWCDPPSPRCRDRSQELQKLPTTQPLRPWWVPKS